MSSKQATSNRINTTTTPYNDFLTWLLKKTRTQKNIEWNAYTSSNNSCKQLWKKIPIWTFPAVQIKKKSLYSIYMYHVEKKKWFVKKELKNSVKKCLKNPLKTLSTTKALTLCKSYIKRRHGFLLFSLDIVWPSILGF